MTGCVLVSFITRLLASLRGRLFCYNAVASAAITVILPGFTICESTPSMGHYVDPKRLHSDGCTRNILQEHHMRRRTSRLRNHLHLYPRKSLPSLVPVPRLTGNGQGFGLTIGSEFYLLFNESAATNTDGLAVTRSIEYLTGFFIPLNASMEGAEPNQTGFGVSLEIALPPDETMHMIKGRCYSSCRLRGC